MELAFLGSQLFLHWCVSAVTRQTLGLKMHPSVPWCPQSPAHSRASGNIGWVTSLGSASPGCSGLLFYCRAGKPPQSRRPLQHREQKRKAGKAPCSAAGQRGQLEEGSGGPQHVQRDEPGLQMTIRASEGNEVISSWWKRCVMGERRHQQLRGLGHSDQWALKGHLQPGMPAGWHCPCGG